MKRIAIYFSDPDPEGPPFQNAGYRAAYVSLSACIQQRGGECFVVRGRESFLGAGTFTHGWRLDAHGSMHLVQGPPRVDVVYNKGESFAGDRRTLLINAPSLDTLCRDKERTLQQWKTIMPRTAVARSFTELKHVLSGHAPDDRIVVKPTHGWGGRGVLISTPADVAQQVQEYPVLVQEFVDTGSGIPGMVMGNHDLRCVVVNGTIALCTVRTPAEGSLVANLARGASLTIIASDRIPQEPRKIVEGIDSFLRKYSTRIYSVDFGRAPDGRWFVFELNPQPGLTALHWGSDVHVLYNRIAEALLGASSDLV